MNVAHCVIPKVLDQMLLEKLSCSKILADEINKLKERPEEEQTYEEMARIVIKKIEERAIIERTKLQKSNHTKQLVDQLQGTKAKGPKVAAVAKKKAAQQDGDEKKEHKKNSELTPAEKKNKRQATTAKKK